MNQCLNDKCKKQFRYPGKKVESQYNEAKRLEIMIEIPVCPHCQSPFFLEAEKPEKVEIQPESVFVFQLGVHGEQKKITELISEGYVIIARYAKNYILEKFPEVTKNEL